MNSKWYMCYKNDNLSNYINKMKLDFIAYGSKQNSILYHI